MRVKISAIDGSLFCCVIGCLEICSWLVGYCGCCYDWLGICCRLICYVWVFAIEVYEKPEETGFASVNHCCILCAAELLLTSLGTWESFVAGWVSVSS